MERLVSDGRIVVVAVLGEGMYFGERGVLFESRRRATVRTLCFVESSILTRADLENVLKEFPDVKKVIRKNLAKEAVSHSLKTGELVALTQDQSFLKKHEELQKKCKHERSLGGSNDTAANAVCPFHTTTMTDRTLMAVQNVVKTATPSMAPNVTHTLPLMEKPQFVTDESTPIAQASGRMKVSLAKMKVPKLHKLEPPRCSNPMARRRSSFSLCESSVYRAKDKIGPRFAYTSRESWLSSDMKGHRDGYQGDQSLEPLMRMMAHQQSMLASITASLETLNKKSDANQQQLRQLHEKVKTLETQMQPFVASNRTYLFHR